MLQRFESFVTGITVCYKYLQKIKSTKMTEFGLKGIHVMCLFFLSHSEEPLTAAQLCQLCAEDKAAVSRALSILSEKGLMQTGEKRYRAQLRLTEEGILVARKIDDLVMQWVSSGGDGLSDEERSTFYYCLSLISQNLRKKLEHPEL